MQPKKRQVKNYVVDKGSKKKTFSIVILQCSEIMMLLCHSCNNRLVFINGILNLYIFQKKKIKIHGLYIQSQKADKLQY